jgi:hypothetical protein
VIITPEIAAPIMKSTPLTSANRTKLESVSEPAAIKPMHATAIKLANLETALLTAEAIPP